MQHTTTTEGKIQRIRRTISECLHQFAEVVYNSSGDMDSSQITQQDSGNMQGDTPQYYGAVVGNLPTYTGKFSQNWVKWLDTFDRMAVAHKWNEERKLQILPSLMTDNAAVMYSQLDKGDKDTYAHLITALSRVFNNISLERLRTLEFNSCRQEENETAERFADRLDGLSREACPSTEGEERNRMLLIAFIAGLRPNLRTLVLASDVMRLEDAILVARRVELRNIDCNSHLSVKVTATCLHSTPNIPEVQGGSMEEKHGKRKRRRGKPISEEGRHHYYDRKLKRTEKQFKELEATGTINGLWNGKPICYKCKKVGHIQRYCQSSRETPLLDTPRESMVSTLVDTNSNNEDGSNKF